MIFLLVIRLTTILAELSLDIMKVVVLIGALFAGSICFVKGADADRISESVVGNTHGAKTLLAKGLECETKYQWSEASEAYRQALKLNPDDAAAKD